MENELYNKYRKFFNDVDGESYWQLSGIIAAAMFFFVFYGFNIWVFFYELKIAAGVTMLSALSMLLGAFGLKRQIKLRNKAKQICADGMIIEGEVLEFTTHVAARTVYSKAKLRLPDGNEKSIILNCGKFGMKKYIKHGAVIIKSKKTKQEIILYAKKINIE